MREPSCPAIDSLSVIQAVFKDRYSIELSSSWAELTALRLEQLSFLKRVIDQYAGTYLIPKTSFSSLLQVDEVRKLRPQSSFVQAMSGGRGLLARVFANERFWADLDGHLKDAAGADVDVDHRAQEVQASERLVTLTHNQQLEIESAATTVIDELSKENSIDGDASLRDQMLGQLRAGRELIRAQFVKAWLLEQTVCSVLNSLVHRYGDKALGEVAKKLLDLLIDNVFGK